MFYLVDVSHLLGQVWNTHALFVPKNTVSISVLYTAEHQEQIHVGQKL